MSQLDEFQKEFKDAQKRYKTALKEYKEANKRLSAIQQRLTGRALKTATTRVARAKAALKRSKSNLKSAKRQRDILFAAHADIVGHVDNMEIHPIVGYGYDIFYGGIEKPCGMGHGHVVIDRRGKVVYKRDPTFCL
jgi:hypothetical protein